MSIDRRKILGLFAAGAASSLAACGGGADVYIDGGSPPPPLARAMWLLNVNPEFASSDVSFGAVTVASPLPFPGLTSRFDAEYGLYTLSLRNRANGLSQNFDNVPVDSNSTSMFVFYRRFASTRLGASPLVPGITNYFDSTVGLDVDLFDDAGGFQGLNSLAFEGSATQASRSLNCALRLYAAGSSVLVYDSGLQARTDSILIFPRFPAASARSGEIAVVGLNYSFNSASAVSWGNTLG
jgi:hypothetical protein